MRLCALCVVRFNMNLGKISAKISAESRVPVEFNNWTNEDKDNPTLSESIVVSGAPKWKLEHSQKQLEFHQRKQNYASRYLTKVKNDGGCLDDAPKNKA